MKRLAFIVLASLLFGCQSTSEYPGVNSQDSFGWSPLHMVASNQYLKNDEESAEMVKFIVNNGGNLELADSLGDTPLVIAVSHNMPLTIEALIAAKANINSNAQNTRSPLMRALFMSNPERVQQLINHNVDVNLTNEQGWSPLHMASSKLLPDNDKSALIVEQLIASGANIEANNKDLCTPLILAVINNKTAMVEQLLNAKAQVNAQDKNGWTPLMHAASNGHKEILEILISHQADTRITTHEGWSVLHLLTSPLAPLSDQKKSQLIEYLIASGAQIDPINKQGRTPLHFAASTGINQTLNILIQAGANIEKNDLYGWTPLMRAVHLKKIKTLKDLIALGANVNAQDTKGWTALHHAVSPVREKESLEKQQARNQAAIDMIEQTNTLADFKQATQTNPYIQIVFTLIEHGANIETKNLRLRTPLYVAVSYQELLTSAALLHAGSNVDTYAFNNWTPLYRAISEGNIPLVKLLLQYQPSVNHKTTKLGWDALFMATNTIYQASDSNQAKIIPLLLQAGAVINETSNAGLTAAMNAAINGKILTLQALVEAGANIKLMNAKENNKMALDYAIENEHLNIEVFIKSLSH